ncbi:hypothetical protein FRB99_005137 [Tulasnella sp. 403]|nr:hypothetical protein FRB99_005137 [Tulasnella sp. 403]
MFSRLATLVLFAWFTLLASAKISILAPSSTYWWVANSQNLYSWTCGTSNNDGYTNFTVLVTNQNTAVLSGPLALVAIQWDYDCSILLPAVASLNPGSGYILQFGDVYNQTNIIASSEPFEIKPQGSAYAPQPSNVPSATVTAGTNATASSTASSSPTHSSSAMSMGHLSSGSVAATVLALIGAGLVM